MEATEHPVESVQWPASPKKNSAATPNPPPAQKQRASARGMLMVSLSRYFSNPANMQGILAYITGESPVSLRLIDWFVTNYAKKHNVILTHEQGDNNVVHLNVHLSYRSQLKAYSKQQFDPFRRRDRIVFYYEADQSVETTVGQLNFFRWMLQNRVLTYVDEHVDAIEADMLAAQHAAVVAKGVLVDEDGDGDGDGEERAEGTGGGCTSPVLGGKDTHGNEHARQPCAGDDGKVPACGAGTAQAAVRRRRGELTLSEPARFMTRVGGARTVAFE